MNDVLLWIIIVVLFLFIVRKISWLIALDAALKKTRRMRQDIRSIDASELESFVGDRIDLSELDTITKDLEKLGFQVLGVLMGKTTYDPPAAPTSTLIVDPHKPIESSSKVNTETTAISRVFGHPTYGCYASVISAIAVSKFDPASGMKDKIKIAPFRTTIATIENISIDSWQFSNTNREVDPFLLLLRHPHKMTHRICGATPEQLLQAHLTERDDIARRGGIRWNMEPSMEKCIALEQAAVSHIQSIKQDWKTFPVAWHLLTYKFKSHDWWLGELEKPKK